ncbi:ephrin-B2a-like [Boleophthalmus pectinirostris]|uniref:ephrin-B2a-like n=1 Tax=Boleophthalmus pectinirostris TaxID=150288 RepID=UPI00242EFEA4|nr:ephrin-B2a-like [Boleophthalmus pectinirostris]
MGTVSWRCGPVLVLTLVCSCLAITLESIHWSSSNTKFVRGLGLTLYPQIGDKMDIVCPRSEPGQREEFYRVYLVSRRQMDTCVIEKTDTPLLNCDKPHKDVKFTFKFQEFSPNLWGLEFLKGKDYYITSTSTGSLQGLDNINGGVCRAKSMKLVLRVGQNSSEPLSTLQESPTRFPPTRPKSKAKEPDPSDVKDFASEAGQTNPSGADGSDPGLVVWLVSGGVLLLLVAFIVSFVVLWKRRRGHCVPDGPQSASVSLNTLTVPKRDSISSDMGSDRSDVVFPLRASDSMIYRHFERVNSDYGPPVYIVQEIAPQTPTNIYYKV